MSAPAIETLLQANETFYEAFEQRDLQGMAALWEQSARALCVHPGWPPLRGWMNISASWYTLFTNLEELHFLIDSAVAHVVGKVGWVSCEENLLDQEDAGKIVALNLFVWNIDRWLVVAHIGSPRM